MIDRRSVTAMLAGSGVMASSSMSGRGDETGLLAGVKTFLRHAVRGTLVDYLRQGGSRAPVIERVWVPPGLRGDQVFPRLMAGADQLLAGDYLSWPTEGRVDVRVDLADGGRAICRFQVGAASEGWPVTSVRLGAADDTPFYVSVAQHGASGRPDQDASAAVQAAYDQLVATGGGTLFFPPGDYRIALRLTSRAVHLVGAGANVTRLRPARPGQPVLQALYTSGSWDRVGISKLGLVGSGTGVGFLAGRIPYVLGDEFAGRTAFNSVRFERFGTCIMRPDGQIGLWLTDCQFESADYHLVCHGHQAPGEMMHAGTMAVDRCHFSGANKAVLRIESPQTGSGQIVFDTCLFEFNAGHVLLVRGLNNQDSTPAMVLRSCWNEQNATAAQVNIDGTPTPPVFGSFRDTGMILFEDTPLGSVTLRSATIATLHCSLDQFRIVATDASSTVTHSAARGFGSFQPVGRTLSVAAAYQFLPGRALSFTMPARGKGKTAPAGTQLLLAQTLGPLRTVGAGTVQDRPDRQWPVASGMTTRLLEEVGTAAASWLVWLFQYRLTQGPTPRLDIGGGVGIGSATLDAKETVCLAGMTYLAEPASSLSFYLAGGPGGNASLVVGPVNLVAFRTRQAALDFLNADHWLDSPGR